MKTIIAEKPSVAREIARIVGATEREEGYFTGNDYNVTWAFGQGRLYQMPECPSDVVAVTCEVTFLSFSCPYDTGYFSCH